MLIGQGDSPAMIINASLKKPLSVATWHFCIFVRSHSSGHCIHACELFLFWSA